MKKKCFKCNKTKPLYLFYVHPQMADGHLNKCKTCTKRDVKQRYDSHEGRRKVRLYEQFRFTLPERKLANREYARKRKKLSPGKVAANNAVSYAIKSGRLVRQPCEKCGNPQSEAHHDDYRKKLTVRWLCFKHHREAHGQIVGDL